MDVARDRCPHCGSALERSGHPAGRCCNSVQSNGLEQAELAGDLQRHVRIHLGIESDRESSLFAALRKAGRSENNSRFGCGSGD
jgi:hypothetical protein